MSANLTRASVFFITIDFTGEIINIETEIQNAQIEIQELKMKILKQESFLLGLMKGSSLTTSRNEKTLRKGTLLYNIYEILLDAKEPLHIKEIIKRMGKEETAKVRVSLVGSLGSYVRRGFVFNRTAPNTFSLNEFYGPAL